MLLCKTLYNGRVVYYRKVAGGYRWTHRKVRATILHYQQEANALADRLKARESELYVTQA